MKTIMNQFRLFRVIGQFGSRWCGQCWQRLASLNYRIAILFFLISSWGVAFADGDDYLADAKPSVDATFGASSTFIHFVYLAEVISLALLFNQKKNPIHLINLPLLLIATKYFFKKIGMG